MQTAMIWLNPCMGKNGWVYWMIICLFIFPVLVMTLFGFQVLQPGWADWERIIFVAGVMYCCHQMTLAICGLRVGACTAKKIELTPCDLRLLTFSGKSVSFSRSQSWVLRKKCFTKTYHRILFQKDREHLVIQDKNHTCYISAYTEDFANLSARLEDIRQANSSKGQSRDVERCAGY
jgi:hypothetical protein